MDGAKGKRAQKRARGGGGWEGGGRLSVEETANQTAVNREDHEKKRKKVVD